MVTMPGNVSEDGEPCESGPGHTGGLSTIMTTEAVMPKAIPVSAPVVVKRRHSSASSSGGKLALAAKTKAMLTSTVTLKPEPIASVPRIAATPTPIEAIAGDLALGLLAAAPEHVPPQVVGDRARARRSRGPATTARIVAKAAAENSARAMSPPTRPVTAAERLRQQRRGEVAALADRLGRALAEHGAGAEADDRHHRRERRDDADRVEHGLAGRVGVRAR